MPRRSRWRPPWTSSPIPTDTTPARPGRARSLMSAATGPGRWRFWHAAFTVLFVWKGARADELVVFGPRFAIYTPVVRMSDGAPALDARAALREDANAIDRLCRLALRTYDDWRTSPCSTTPLRVFVDDEERPVAIDG